MSLSHSNTRPGAGPRRCAAALLLALAAAALAGGAPKQAAAQLATPESPAKTFKNWTVACGQRDGAQETVCQMTQEVLSDSGTRAMGVMITPVGPDKVMGAIIFLPLGLYLPPGVELRIDEQEPVRLSYDVCTPNNCQVRFELKEPILGQMRAGTTGHVTLIDMKRQQKTLDFSLAGFTKALAEVH